VELRQPRIAMLREGGSIPSRIVLGKVDFCLRCGLYRLTCTPGYLYFLLHTIFRRPLARLFVIVYLCLAACPWENISRPYLRLCCALGVLYQVRVLHPLVPCLTSRGCGVELSYARSKLANLIIYIII